MSPTVANANLITITKLDIYIKLKLLNVRIRGIQCHGLHDAIYPKRLRVQ